MTDHRTRSTFTWRPMARARAMVDIVNGALAEYSPRTLRGLHYYTVTKHGYPNTPANYEYVMGVCTLGRKAGLIPWDGLVDEGRGAVTRPSWADPQDFLASAISQYRLDPWDRQPTYVEVVVEKAALVGLLKPACDEFRVPVTAAKGSESWTDIYVMAGRLAARADAGAKLVVLHLADFDPMGWDMTRDLQGRLNFFEVDARVARVALNPKQASAYPSSFKEPKRRDKLGKAFAAKFGRVSVELDAVPPAELQAMVRKTILRYVDLDALDRTMAQEDRDRRRLAKLG